MSGSLRVWASFDEIGWTNYIYAVEGRGPFSSVESPYLWTTFFKMDGESIQINNRGKLLGYPIVAATRGGCGNLGVARIESSQRVPIPPSIGRWSDTLLAIPGIAGRERLRAIDTIAIVGVATVLMRENGLSAHRTEVAHRILNHTVRAAIVGLFPGSNVHDVTALLPGRVARAVVVAEKSWRNKWPEEKYFDQVIDHATFMWSISSTGIAHGRLSSAVPGGRSIFTHRYAPGWWEGWELKGAVGFSEFDKKIVRAV